MKVTEPTAYEIHSHGIPIGTSRLENIDAPMRLASGRMLASAAYDQVRAVFRLFADALPPTSIDHVDNAQVNRYFAARDALSLQLRSLAGRIIPTEWIHVEDFGDLDDLVVTACIDADDIFWSPTPETHISPAIQRRIVVAGPHGLQGIVCGCETKASERWIADQINKEAILELDERVPWWGVAPFRGGYALVPQPHLRHLRDPTFADFLDAIDHANEHGRRHLAGLFPKFIEAAIKRKQHEH